MFWSFVLALITFTAIAYVVGYMVPAVMDYLVIKKPLFFKVTYMVGVCTFYFIYRVYVF